MMTSKKIFISCFLSCILLVFALASYLFIYKGAIYSTPSLLLDDIHKEQVAIGSHPTLVISGSLFGISPQSTKKLTETSLNLILKGTFPVVDGAGKGMAIIMIAGKKEKVVHRGDTILRGVTLEDVFDQYVVISRADTREVLKFPKNDDNSEEGKYLTESL